MLQIIYSEEMMIKINNLTKKYKEKYAVNNLNLEIKSGEPGRDIWLSGC